MNGQSFHEYSSALTLHTSATLTDDPVPTAVPRLFKSLPLTTTAGALFDLCRPFGPVHRVALQLAEGPRRGSGSSTVFRGQALVTFYVRSDQPATARSPADLLVRRMKSMPSSPPTAFTVRTSMATPSSCKTSSRVVRASQISGLRLRLLSSRRRAGPLPPPPLLASRPSVTVSRRSMPSPHPSRHHSNSGPSRLLRRRPCMPALHRFATPSAVRRCLRLRALSPSTLVSSASSSAVIR